MSIASAARQPACPICASSDTVQWRKGGIGDGLVSDDLRITDARYGLTLDLARCQVCKFCFADSEEIAHLDELYADLDDPGYQGSQKPRRLQMKWLVRTVRTLHPTAKTALDVGAATGLLVGAARRAGLEAIGVEPSRALSQVARERNGEPVLTGVLPHRELEGRRFDVVFLVDVIEHVANPLDLLRRCAEMLDERGVLLVVTPDVGSLAARMLGRRWWHFRIAHVGYFDRRSLHVALAQAGLQAERWLRARWFFDVAYLASRLESYLPVHRLNALAERVAPLRWLHQRVIPVNLLDSYAVLARPARTR